MPGVDGPTLKESGVDVAVQNWRMVAAAPGISEEQKATITADIEKMVNSAAWQNILESKGWVNTYLSGDAFTEQLERSLGAAEQARITNDVRCSLAAMHRVDAGIGDIRWYTSAASQ